MLHPPSDQFRARFHKVIATIPNIIADVKFLNKRTIKKESRECVITCLKFHPASKQFHSSFHKVIATLPNISTGCQILNCFFIIS
jgi:hypothetical protein